MHVSKVACPAVMAATWRRGVSYWQGMAGHRRKYLLAALYIPSHAPIVLIKSSCWAAALSSTNSWHSALRHQVDCWSSAFWWLLSRTGGSVKAKTEFWLPQICAEDGGLGGTKNIILTFSRLMTYIYIYIYMSYRTANLQMLHFTYLFNKYTYWIF